ncbi:IQ domain-containing protein IQM1-like [Coffea eugenioides]|uniref:IQ domain-containing protein IQM1-like n=1 Tax=Coffea eugenioides TaxID=49369 RepID=UPI000F606C58|nr:IQ domain-containing protein IQM1-like [Coffea eugenioides]
MIPEATNLLHAMLVMKELDAALARLQKGDNISPTKCRPEEIVDTVEKLRWRILDVTSLMRSSVTFVSLEQPETAVSRWSRAKIRVAKLVKGLCVDEKAQKLVLKYWLEAIDPCHRYGGNLHLYYVEWLKSQSPQPFFYWLDFGDGREVSLDQCPRISLQDQCIQYLGPKEREAYEVIIECGKLVYMRSGCPVDTPEDTKWIFVLSTRRKLYVGEKKKGLFQHSSFFAGGATIAAGRLISCNGTLQVIKLAIWSYSGHYRPPEENFVEMIRFLEGHHVDLSHVKTFPLDDDVPPPPPPPPRRNAPPEERRDSETVRTPPRKNPSTADNPYDANNL